MKKLIISFVFSIVFLLTQTHLVYSQATTGAGSSLNLSGVSNVFEKIWGPGSNGILLGGGLNYSTQPGVGWSQQYDGLFVTSYSIQGSTTQYYLTQSNSINVSVTGPAGAIIEVWDLEDLTVIAKNITNPGSPVIFTAQPNHRYGGFAWYADNSQKDIAIYAAATSNQNITPTSTPTPTPTESPTLPPSTQPTPSSEDDIPPPVFLPPVVSTPSPSPAPSIEEPVIPLSTTFTGFWKGVIPIKEVKSGQSRIITFKLCVEDGELDGLVNQGGVISNALIVSQEVISENEVNIDTVDKNDNVATFNLKLLSPRKLGITLLDGIRANARKIGSVKKCE